MRTEDTNEAEARLRDSEERFRALFETTAQGVVYQNTQGEVISANPAAERILGLTLDQLQGRTARDPGWRAVHEDGSDFADNTYPALEVLRTGQPVTNVIMGVYVPTENQYHWCNVNAFPQFHPGETVPHQVCTTFEDITERKHLEALVRAQRDLARSIGTYNSVEAGFGAILDTVLRLSGMDSGGIYLFAPDAQSLDLIYHQGLGAEFIQAVASFSIDSPNAQMVLTGKPFYFPHGHPVTQSPRYQAEQLLSGAAIPILYQDRVIGCFNLASHIYADIRHFARQALETLAVEVGNFIMQLQSQAALRAGEEKFRQIADTINEVFWIFDNERQRLVYLNPAYAKVWGISIEDTYRDNRKYIDAIHPDDRPILFAALARQAQGEQTEMEYRIVRPDGAVRWIFDRSFPILGEDGRVRRTTGVATDITDRKETYEALHESEEKYRSLAEASDAIIVLLDADGRIHYVNERATTMGGARNWRVEDVLGRTLHELPQPLAELYLLRVQQVIATDQSVLMEVSVGPKDYRVSIQPIHDAQGKAVMAMLSATDVTALKQVQQELQELNRSLEERVAQRTAEVQDLYDNAPTGYHSLDANGCLLQVNQTELKWMGYTREEVIGRSAMEFVTDADRPALLANLSVLKLHGFVRDFEFDLVRKDGSTLPVLLNAVAVYDEQGNFVASRSTLVDNTERRRAEQALRASEETLRLANVELARALRMKDEFLANMSHELRTPLHGILAVSETLLDQIRGPLNERQQKSVGLIEESGRHLLALINDLLDLSKIEAGKLDLHWAAVAVDELCRASLLFVRGMAAKKEIQVEYTNVTPGVHVFADEQRLKQMLVNLLSNAVKFTPNGGHVCLGVAVDPDAGLIHFAVQDNGPGIAPAEQARLFQPFVQIDSQLSRQYEGSGLGLALVKRLAEQHGGTVRLDSTGIRGEGACFTVTLPYQPGN
ncbi:MAG: PAS domain S-box protein [Caldilineaceae bacterium]